MRKLKIIITFCFVFVTILFSDNIFALTSSDLISVGSGKYAITVNNNTTIEQIEAKLGEPKIVTPSAFGGKAYTFYTDSNYSNYLYIETTSGNKIISFGSVDPTYQTNTYSFGSKYNYTENRTMHGCIYNNSGTVAGGVYYNTKAYINGSYSQTITNFINTYESNPTHYLKGISEHGVTMYNALNANIASVRSNLRFDEDFFYINEQLKESGSSIRTYLRTMNKSNYMQGIGVGENISLSNSNYYLFSPMVFANFLKNNKSANFGEKTIAIFDYDIDNKLLTAIAVGEDLFKKYDSVSLTAEELSKLSSGRYEYNEAKKNLNKDSEMYDVNPQSTNVSTLLAGELKDSKKQGITDYVNAIRVAAGLPKVKVNSQNFLVAQHISTLISYRYTELGLGITHMPAKPTGLSDSYYNIALGDGKGYAENLGYLNASSSVSSMMHHINLFLDDSSETPQNFSHRQKVLDPTFTDFGYGISPYTFANEFSGGKKSDICMQAWPAEGITFIESLVSNRFTWTAQFLKKYKVKDNTTVTVKCLNTSKTWTFINEEKTSSRRFERVTTQITSLNNKVVFYDSSIYPEQGYVYEITVHNLLDEDTNKTVDYTYRSVFEYADENNYPTSSNSIKIDASKLSKVTGENVYYVPVGEESKASVILDENVVDKKVTWISSNPHVKVTQNGTIIPDCILDEDVIISVSYDEGNLTDEIVVRPYNKIEQVKLTPNSLIIDVGKEAQTQITYTPTEANEITEIVWKIVSDANPGIQYDIDNSYIRKYIKVDVLSEDKRNIKITAVDTESNNNTYKIIANVKGISGEYTGTCRVEVRVPLNYITIGYNNRNNSGLSISRTSMTDPGYSTIDYKKFYQNNGTSIIRFKTTYDPENTTVNKDIKWSLDKDDGSTNILTEYDNVGGFRIDKEGTAKIIAENVETGYKAYLYLTIESTLESLKLSSSNKNIKLSKGADGNYTATDKLTLTREPSIDTDEVEYTTSNSNIAKVDGNGNVKFNGETGNVKITVKSKNNPRIYAEYTYSVSIPVEQLILPIAGTIKTITKGESIQYEATCSPSNSNANKNIRYLSSNTNIASVDSKGIVKGISTGTATITARISGDYTKTGRDINVEYKVHVIVPVESISTNYESLTIIKEEGNIPNLNVTINPSDYSGNASVKWTSSNTDVLTIDSSSGKITPLKSGRATVTVTVTINDINGTSTFTKDVSVTVKSINDPKYLKGDLDRNGTINANDAAIALDLYKYGNVSDEDMLIGDMDENGTMNANDAALILDIYKYGN